MDRHGHKAIAYCAHYGYSPSITTPKASKSKQRKGKRPKGRTPPIRTHRGTTMSIYTPDPDKLKVVEQIGPDGRPLYFVHDQFGEYDGPYASHYEAARLIMDALSTGQ